MQMTPTFKRLLPLYIASFLQGIPFWYAVEKLFMVSIGFNDATIGLMVVCMGVVILIVETPSGVLADRWSRKGVMLLGCGALALAALVGGLSNNVPMFILSTMLWGVYAAMYSGTYESVVYDTVFEESGASKGYKKYLGQLRMTEGASFITGAIIGGIIANNIGLRETFFISIPFILLAVLFLVRFKEPQLHKADVSEPVLLHIRQTFSAVLKSRYLIPVIAATIFFGVMLNLLFELNQLWFIASNTPVGAFGPIAAVIFFTWTLGGYIAGNKRLSGGVLVLAAILAVIGLLFARHYLAILAVMFVLAAALVALGVVLSQLLHDELPSRLRAGSSSVVGTLTNVVVIPAALLLTTISFRSSIFVATYVLLALGIVAGAAYFLIRHKTAQA